jgi:murE/murF fusion protein
MLLSELCAELVVTKRVGADVPVRRVVEDSRAVQPGDLFVAVRGRTVDGHAFVRAAVDAGAAALVVEDEQPVDLPQVVVPSTAKALGPLTARAAGNPGERVRLIGVTGTNGKTTTTYLVENMLRAAGARPGVIGTVSFRFAGKERPATYTTPTPGELHELLGDMVEAAVTDVVMEASSAALEMDRLGGLPFRVAAFSNLTQDHLDVHGTMEAYQAAKARLFSEVLARDGAAVVNLDDPAGAAMLAAAPPSARRIAVSTRGPADVALISADSSVHGLRARFATPVGELAVASERLFGDYNLANIGLALGIGVALGLPTRALVDGVAAAEVPGRVQLVPNPRGLKVFVDYAHTPDALERVIAALRPLVRTPGRLIVVFGCGGDRDPGKRPKMGRVVAESADVAVVTSDNPRTEDPRAIIDMILAGIDRPVVVEPDRRAAIGCAVRLATPEDIVLIAGKGHEDYQILGKTKIHFDDREEALAAITARIELGEVYAAAHGSVDRVAATAFGGVSIDGRTARRGDLYFAIRGESHDGHDFVEQAVAAGADGVVVERALEADATIVRVADARVALGQVARGLRRRWGGRVIGVTGSTGKTSTKQLLAAALGGVFGPDAVLATEGSLNNETGVPLTLARLTPRHRVAVVEMGMRGLGHIDYLAAVAEPDVGVVVNVGLAHVGVVGSVDDIARGKAEMWSRLPTDGVAVYPAGDARLRSLAAGRRAVTYGPGGDVDVASYGARGQAGVDVVFNVHGRELVGHMPLFGRHNAENAACAIAAVLALDLDLAAAVAGLAQARADKMRGELVQVGGLHVLLDAYNANPASMRAGLTTLVELAAGKPAVAVVGDMLELGAVEEEEHAAIGRALPELGVTHLITLGERAREIARAARAAGVPHVEVVHVDDLAGAARLAAAWAAPDGWILVKASRGMRLERVVTALKEHLGGGT